MSDRTKIKVKTYRADKTAELGHPNAKGILHGIIDEILTRHTGTSVYSLEQLHQDVYAELWGKPDFEERCKYEFTYEFKYLADFVENGTTSNLLLFLIVINELVLLTKILKTCTKEDLSGPTDSLGNNALHLTAFYKRHDMLPILLEYSKDKVYFRNLLNARNKHGTNPLGMFFLNLTSPLHDNVILQCFINEPNFEINSYLNNGIGMDVFALPHLQRIGGMNCLHLSLKEKQIVILQTLGKRDKILEGKLPIDNKVNFRYPAQNPEHHMWSPAKFTDLIFTKAGGEHREEIKQLYSKIVEDLGGSDDSGDSDVEDTPAWHYKRGLMDLVKVANADLPSIAIDFPSLNQSFDVELPSSESDRIAKELDKLVVVHFHGIPFMQGHYFNQQRREIGKHTLATNRKNFAGTALEKRELHIRGIHSRTSMATIGIQNLYGLLQATDETLERLSTTDQRLRKYLMECWKKKPGSFINSLSSFVYDFSSNPMRPFWTNLADCLPIEEGIVKYRFPNISTSKAPDHPIKFGFGTNVETQARGEMALAPRYDANGFPKHRLAGFLYVTLYSLQEILEMKEGHLLADLPQLLRTKKLKSKKPGTNSQLEVNFFGGIDGRHVVAVIPLLYPNFNKKFNEEYHHGVWNFIHFENAKYTFKEISIPKFYDEKGFMSSCGKVLMPIYIRLAMKLAQQIARKKSKELCYISPTGEICDYDIMVLETKSKVQETLASMTPTRQGTPKEEVTPESQRRTASKVLLYSDVRRKLDFSDLIAEDINPVQLQAFLKHVVAGQQDEAEIMLKQSPTLALKWTPLSRPNLVKF